MTESEKQVTAGCGNTDESRRRALKIMAAVTVLGVGLGVRMDEVFANETRATAAEGQAAAATDVKAPVARQGKSTPDLVLNCDEKGDATKKVRAPDQAPGAHQNKASPKLMLHCAEAGGEAKKKQ